MAAQGAPTPCALPPPTTAAAPTCLCQGQHLAGPSLGLGQRGANSPEEALGIFPPCLAPSSWSTHLGKMEPPGPSPYIPALGPLPKRSLCPHPKAPLHLSGPSQRQPLLPGTRVGWEDQAPSDKPTALKHCLRLLECLKTVRPAEHNRNDGH